MSQKAKLLFNLDRKQEAKDLVISLLKKDSENERYWIYLHYICEDIDS